MMLALQGMGMRHQPLGRRGTKKLNLRGCNARVLLLLLLLLPLLLLLLKHCGFTFARKFISERLAVHSSCEIICMEL